MSVHVELQPLTVDGAGPSIAFEDRDLPDRSGVYCYHVGGGGQLVILVDVRGESRVERCYGPAAWRCVEGEVWRKGMLLQG
jgi:hypothetical protein